MVFATPLPAANASPAFRPSARLLQAQTMPYLEPLTAHLAELRSLLSSELPWSPHNFIPGISREGDRRWYAEQLTAPLAAEDDLRVSARLASGRSLAIFAQRLPWDSQFFGYGVARLNAIFGLERPLHHPADDYRPALAQWLELASRRGIRYVIATNDPRDLATTRALGELGFVLLETRYFHHGPVSTQAPRERIPLRTAVLDDLSSLARAARDMVNPYDRFHADPWLDRQHVDRLMEEWVARSITGEMADLVLVPDVPEPAAFVTYRLHRDRWDTWGLPVVQGVLSAVAREFLGWLGHAGPEIEYQLSRLGARYTFGSTQVTNQPIIHFAQEAGARFGRCEHLWRRLL